MLISDIFLSFYHCFFFSSFAFYFSSFGTSNKKKIFSTIVSSEIIYKRKIRPKKV